MNTLITIIVLITLITISITIIIFKKYMSTKLDKTKSLKVFSAGVVTR